MTATRSTSTARHRQPVQYAALAFGVVFLLVGIAGFIPGITTAYDTMQFAGHESEAMLLGLFQVSILHNIVHLLFGVGGVIYLALWIYGLVTDHESSANFVPLNTADNWLHLVLGVAMVGLSFLYRGTIPAGRDTTAGD